MKFEMKYLPYEKYTFETLLEKDEVLRRISGIIRSEKSMRFLNDAWEPSFEGQVTENSFRLKRIINYRNSFLPILTATIESKGGICILKIQMRLMHSVLGFMMIWMTGVLIGLFAFGAMAIFDAFSPVVFVPLGMLIFGYLLTTLAFKYESKKYKSILMELLELNQIERKGIGRGQRLILPDGRANKRKKLEGN